MYADKRRYKKVKNYQPIRSLLFARFAKWDSSAFISVYRRLHEGSES